MPSWQLYFDFPEAKILIQIMYILHKSFPPKFITIKSTINIVFQNRQRWITYIVLPLNFTKYNTYDGYIIW